MSYYYKTMVRQEFVWNSDGDNRIYYVVTQYEGPFRTETECVTHAVDCGYQDFEVIELP